jgi:isocitrate lyase
MYSKKEIDHLAREWDTNPRWKGVERPYSPEDVIKMRGSIRFDYTLARMGAEKLWQLFETEPFVRALGAVTGCQAVQQIQAGLKAIYASGWQVAADGNDARHTYPDLSLYPVMSMPHLVQRLNNALIRADQIHHMKNDGKIDWFAPIVADAEAGFGGSLNTYELIKALIEAGVAAVHLEDQLASLKKCGHMGGKVLVGGKTFIEKLIAARFAADVLGVPTIIIGRTDAHSASLIGSDYDQVDAPFMTGDRSPEGYYHLKGGIQYAIARALEFAPYCDVVWCETSKPILAEAKTFAEEVHKKYPGKPLAYNCSPSFNWKAHLSEGTIGHFQEKLGEMGYKFQFVTLAGFHAINTTMFDLAIHYKTEGMTAYSRLQEQEFQLEKEHGYSAVKHQQFVGTGYFDRLIEIFTQGKTSTSALKGSTEEAQF